MGQPDWADHDVSDPGVTLLDLFAFLGERLDFRSPNGRRRLLIVALAAAATLILWRRRDGD